MLRKRLHRILHPKSIAVFGGKHAEQVVNQCLKMEFAGPIWPVHPNKDEVLGLPCSPSLSELPAAPDSVFLGVNRHLTIDLVAGLRAFDAGGVVCYASGFNESGDEGESLAEDLLEAAGDMPIIGPNCYGLINYLDGALLWPDQHGGQRCERGVAILAQSSNIAINLTMQQRGLPVAYIVALGNQLAVGMSEMIEVLAADDRVSAIGLYIEGIDDIARFDKAIAQARKLNKPVVALKSGKSDAAKAMTMSHTASVAGGDAAFSSLLRRLGIGQVDSLPVFLDTLKLLHHWGPLRRRDIISFSCSGGEASLMADAAEAYNVKFKPFTEEQIERVKKTVNPLVRVSNPFDYHTFDWANEANLGRTFSEALACNFEVAIVLFDVPREDRCDTNEWWPTLNALADAARVHQTHAMILSSLPENLPEHWIEQCVKRDLLGMWTINDALAAIEISANIGERWADPHPVPILTPADKRSNDDAGTTIYSEYQAKQLLRQWQIAIPKSMLCEDLQQVRSTGQELGYPLVMKIADQGVAHKTELGGVRLGVKDEKQLMSIASELFQFSGQILVEQMIDDVVAELLVGIAEDPVVGLYLVVGAGGIGVEWLQDTQILTLPTRKDDLYKAIESLKCYPLLSGYRGRPEGDITAVVETMMNISRFVESKKATLKELDINPLMVRSQGKGCVAADALLVFYE